MAAGRRHIYEVEFHLDGVPPVLAKFEGVLAGGPSEVLVAAGATVVWKPTILILSTNVYKTAFCVVHSTVDGVTWQAPYDEDDGTTAAAAAAARALRPAEVYTGIAFGFGVVPALTLINPTSRDAIVTVLYVHETT